MFPKDTKILVIDDMLTMRKIVKRTLNELGFTNLTDAADGADGWSKLSDAASKGSPFQMIISDWNMPVLTGIELLKKVRESRELAKTPFVLLTAEAEKTQVIQALKLGVSGYIVKPITAQQISEQLTLVYNKLPKKAA
jgi:two-component system chemotaxis response regulator CheY